MILAASDVFRAFPDFASVFRTLRPTKARIGLFRGVPRRRPSHQLRIASVAPARGVRRRRTRCSKRVMQQCTGGAMRRPCGSTPTIGPTRTSRPGATRPSHLRSIQQTARFQDASPESETALYCRILSPALPCVGLYRPQPPVAVSADPACPFAGASSRDSIRKTSRGAGAVPSRTSSIARLTSSTRRSA